MKMENCPSSLEECSHWTSESTGANYNPTRQLCIIIQRWSYKVSVHIFSCSINRQLFAENKLNQTISHFLIYHNIETKQVIWMDGWTIWMTLYTVRQCNLLNKHHILSVVEKVFRLFTLVKVAIIQYKNTQLQVKLHSKSEIKLKY